MLYKALVSFSGVVSMGAGEVGEIPNPAVAADLLKCGYVETVGEENLVERAEKPVEGAKTPVSADAKPTKKGRAKK